MNARVFLSLAALALASSPLLAIDFGGLTKGLDTLKKGMDTAKDAAKISKAAGIGPKEERSIGDSVALEIISRYGGLVRDEPAMRRINLIGLAMARASDRPDLDWRFAILASDSVNAFSAPGGYVFITRALYVQAGSDDVLAGILGHEIAHITRRHALKIVERNEAAAGAKSQLLKRSTQAREVDAQVQQVNATLGADISGMLKTLLVNGFDAPTEFEADQVGRALAVTNGFAPGGLRSALVQLQSRGENRQTMFSTHPPLAERLKRLPDDPTLAPEASPLTGSASSAASATGPQKKQVLADLLAKLSAGDPAEIAQLNGQQVRLKAFIGESGWLRADSGDVLFHMVRGSLRVDFRTETITLAENEFLVIPRNAEYRTRADAPASVIVTAPAPKAP